MSYKRFYVRVNLQLHALTCPGVWLCSHGYLEATIKTLGYYFRTGAMEPRFPMLCHDQFTMEGYFKSAGSLQQMQQLLAGEKLELTLWQNGRRLAYFVGTLADVVQPTVPRLSCEHSDNVQLLMKATHAFPGILAPKAELSAQVTTQDKQQFGRRRSPTDIQCAAVAQQLKHANFEVERPVNRHIDSGCMSRLEQRRKQQTVCHAKQSNCYQDNCSCVKSVGSNSSTLDLRRVSTCSSLLSNNSQTLSQLSTGSVCDTANTFTDAEEHLRRCDICQAYRRVFANYNTNK